MTSVRWPAAPRSLVAATGAVMLAALVLGSWALAAPHGAVADTDELLVRIWCQEPDLDRCAEPIGPSAADDDVRLVPERLLEQRCVLADPDASAACLETGGIGGQMAPAVVTPPDAVDGPVGIYVRLHARAVSGDVDASLARIRLVNGGLFLAVTSVAFAIAGQGLRPTMVAGAVPIVPLGLIAAGSLDPLAWTLAGATVMLPMLLTVLGPEHLWRRLSAGAVAIVGGVLLLTPPSQPPDRATLLLVLIGGIVLAVRLASRPHTEGRTVAAVALIALVVVSSVVRSVLPAPLLGPTSGAVGRGLAETGPQLLGRAAVAVPAMLAVTAIVVLAGLRRQGPTGLVVLGAAATVGWALAIGTDVEALREATVRPDAFLPALVVLVGVATLARPSARPLLPGRAANVVAGIVTIVHALALRGHIDRFVAPAGERGGWPLRVEWWWDIPVTPDLVWAVGSLAMAGLAILATPHLAAGRPTPVPEAAR